MKQGITINGTLANIKPVEAKEYDGSITPAKNVLQITVLTDNGLDLINVNDKKMTVKDDAVGKPISAIVSYSVMNNKAYFSLIS